AIPDQHVVRRGVRDVHVAPLQGEVERIRVDAILRRIVLLLELQQVREECRRAATSRDAPELPTTRAENTARRGVHDLRRLERSVCDTRERRNHRGRAVRQTKARYARTRISDS